MYDNHEKKKNKSNNYRKENQNLKYSFQVLDHFLILMKIQKRLIKFLLKFSIQGKSMRIFLIKQTENPNFCSC